MNGPLSVDGATAPAQTNGELVSKELAQDAKAAPVYTFDPDAKPEEKAQLAAQGKDQLLTKDKLQKASPAQALVSDIGSSPAVHTTVTAADASARPHPHGEHTGAYPDNNLPIIPDKNDAWIGWTALANMGSEHERLRRSLLEEYVDDMWYGTVFHNGGVVFFAVFAAHFITRLGGGLGFMLVILAFCATYYSVSQNRTVHRARDDISREMSKKRLFADHETADWMNNFLTRFWIIYEPVLSATIVASVDQVLAVSTPSFLDSMKMTVFTLGNKSPRIEFIRSYPKTEQDVVVMDWKFSFIPHDLSAPPSAENPMLERVNTKIVLSIRIGAGLIGVSHDVVVEDITFQGLMRLRLKLVNNYPHIQTVDISFLEKPLIDYTLKPIGFDLSLIPGLAGFIDSQIHSNLGPMMYDPNVFTLNLEQMLSGEPLDTAVGVLQITLLNARGLKATKIGGGRPDPYVSFTVNNRNELARSKIKYSTEDPRWNETKFILINNLNEFLTLQLFDFNDHRKDSELGVASFELATLENEPEQDGIRTPIVNDGKERGYVHYSISYYPIIKPTKLDDGTEEPIPETRTGVVRLTVHQAKDLDSSISAVGALNPYAQVFLNNQQIYQTHVLKRTNSPVFEVPTEFLVTDREKAVIGVKMVDERDFVKDPTVGYVSMKLDELLTATQNNEDWFPLSKAISGMIRMSASWKPVMMAGAIAGAGSYRAPIGVARFWIKNAKGLKNVESLRGGKSDPYLRVILNGVVNARTMVVNNDLDPEWDEIIYVPIHSNKDRFTVEVMDYENTSPDRSLGIFYLQAGELLQEGPDKKTRPWVSKGKISKVDMLIQEGNKSITKGTVTYDVEFYPCENIDISFEAVENPLDKAKETASNDKPSENPSIISSESPVTPSPLVNGASESDNYESTNGSPKDVPNGDQKSESGSETEESKEEKVVLSKEELLSYPTGVLAINVISGRVSKKGARLEILFDDGYWPAYSTEPARSSETTWDEIAQAFIRERDVSRIILKLNSAPKDSNDDSIGIYTCSVDEFLSQCMDNQAEFTLIDDQGQYPPSTIKISARYIPTEVVLEPRESINNMGFLRVDLLSAKDLPAADRNGKSDPYCRFILNDKEVYKSETKKKTVNPKWNENFECEVPSRVGAKFLLKVYDWDAVGAADKLGQRLIDLSHLEPFQASNYTVKLADEKDGKEQGEVYLRFVFRPQFIVRSRATTSTFGGTAGRVATGIGGGVVGVGGAAVKGVGKGVGGVGRGVFGLGKRITSRGARETTPSIMEEDEAEPRSSMGLSSVQNGPAMQSRVSMDKNGVVAPTGMPGVLRLTVNKATIANSGESHSHAKAIISKGGRNLEKKNKTEDTYIVKTSHEPLILTVTLVDKKFLKDKNIGTIEFDAWQNVNALVPEAVHALEFEGGVGTVELHLAWTPTLPDAGNAEVTTPDTPASTKTSRSRFSTVKKSAAS